MCWKLGFLVGRTKDVISASKNSKGFIQDLSIVDVPVGDVRILSLSSDDSILAVSVAADIHFFSVDSLLKKVYWSEALKPLVFVAFCLLISLVSRVNFGLILKLTSA